MAQRLELSTRHLNRQTHDLGPKVGLSNRVRNDRLFVLCRIQPDLQDDMAAWDALAKAADVPLAVLLLGGTVGNVPAYNSNGLWLTDPRGLHDEAAELVR